MTFRQRINETVKKLPLLDESKILNNYQLSKESFEVV